MDDARFIAAAPETLLAAPLGALTALYHRASAQTHIVSEPAPAILEALAEPLTAAELLDALGGSDADSAALAERLAELESIGLIARQ